MLSRRQFLQASAAFAPAVLAAQNPPPTAPAMNAPADLLLVNGRITTLDPARPESRSLAVKDGRILALDDADGPVRGPDTRVID
ncbi:MAG TPA: twin-arginine translocation signal domain-containing protein, partial [Verrucomicrobiota bacterium]|nr:twin-arginine translocation signal domain-containing protein [Verrucomicrobiota bacterium]